MNINSLLDKINSPLLFELDLLEIQNLALKFQKVNKKKLDLRKKINLSISSDYTTTYVSELLPLFLANHNIDCNILEKEFGSLNFLSHDSSNSFWKNKSDFYLLIPSSKNLKYFPKLNDNNEIIKKKAKQEAKFWTNLWKTTKSNIIQTTFDPINISNFGKLDGIKFGGYLHYIRLVNSILIENLPSNVNLIDIENLIIKNNFCKWNDNKIFNLTKQPYSMNTLPFLAKDISSSISGILGLSKKVIILDLDNTLWGGVIGDDGLNGIILGEETPEGQSFLNFQKFLKSLAHKGIILCVCSKNDPKVAKEVFIKHKHMILTLEDIAMFVSNYENKADNIQKISKMLNLNLDSFIFLDDNKIECELVKKKLPSVMVVNMCDDPSEFIEKIESIAPFYFKNITKEDFTRIKSYKSIGLLNQEKSQSKNIDDFLKNLKPKIKFEKITKDNCVRSSQLIGKTNQFKLNSKIFSSKNLLSRGEKCMPISFEDKFQNYGIIGVIVYSLHPKTKTLIIENWVMSCRVFSRRIENYIINFIIKKLKDKKYNFIKFNFEITGKNLYLQNFIEELGIKLNKKNNNYLVHFNDIVSKKKNYIINIK